MSTPSRKVVIVADVLKTSPTDSHTSGYGSGGELGKQLDPSRPTGVTAMFPHLEGAPECVAALIASAVTSTLINYGICRKHMAAEVRERVVSELSDFQFVVGKVTGERDRLEETQLVDEMKLERDRAWLKTHRLKIEWMGPCTGFGLSMFMYCAEESLLDMSKLRGWKYVEDVDYPPYRYQRAMKLDRRLRELLTQSPKGNVTEEKVVKLLEEILVYYLDRGFTDEDQDCRNGQSFDFSRYKDGLKDEHLFLLLQLSKYIDCCACISHLKVVCCCRSRTEFVKEKETVRMEKNYEITKAPEFEFVPWHKYGFPVSTTALTGHVSEAKQRVCAELACFFGGQNEQIEAVNTGFRSVVEFLKEYVKVGWEVVPKEKLIAGRELEEAYQMLARMNAIALAGISCLNVKGVVQEATTGLEKSFIAYVNKKNSSLTVGQEKLSKSREALWDFIFDNPEGAPLRAIMMGEYVYGAWEGLDFSADILHKKTLGQRLMEGDKAVGIIVSDADFTYEELNFLQALCKFFVLKLKVVSEKNLYSV